MNINTTDSHDTNDNNVDKYNNSLIHFDFEHLSNEMFINKIKEQMIQIIKVIMIKHRWVYRYHNIEILNLV